MKKVAILVDLELTSIAGGHVKFWERICYSIKDSYKDFHLTVFFLGGKFTKKQVGENIVFYTLKPILSSKILRPLGIDADYTDLFPMNLKLFFLLKKFDIIHSTDQLFSMAKTAILASKLWKIPLTTSLHTDAPAYTEYYIKKIFNKLPKFLGYIFIDKLLIHKKIKERQRIKLKNYLYKCSYGMINDKLSLRRFKFPPELVKKICKLSRGVDINIFKRKKINRIELLKKYGISRNERIIFFCGRIHELKGATFLSKIHKILQRKNHEVVSIFAGQNIHGEKCQTIGGKKIKLIGHVNEQEISDLYNLCDLFVFPSRYEIGPQVVLEAKSCGAISIVSPGGGGKRISVSGVDGVIINKYDPYIWVEEIIRLFNDKKKISFMRKKILSDFKPPSWKEVFDIYFTSKWKEVLK